MALRHMIWVPLGTVMDQWSVLLLRQHISQVLYRFLSLLLLGKTGCASGASAISPSLTQAGQLSRAQADSFHLQTPQTAEIISEPSPLAIGYFACCKIITFSPVIWQLLLTFTYVLSFRGPSDLREFKPSGQRSTFPLCKVMLAGLGSLCVQLMHMDEGHKPRC